MPLQCMNLTRGVAIPPVTVACISAIRTGRRTLSCYEWEAGKIILPAGEFDAVCDAVVEAHNRAQTEKYNTALSLYTRLMARGEGQQDFDYRQEFENLTLTVRYPDDHSGIKII